MPLINTLRDDGNNLKQVESESKNKTGADKTDAEEKDDENDKKGYTRKPETITNPFSFYDEDMKKWNEKFG